LGQIYAKQIGLFYNYQYVDISNGNIFSEASNLKASLEALGHQVVVFSDFESLDKSQLDLIIMPELEKQGFLDTHSSDQLEQYKAYVSSGGGIIVMGVVASEGFNNKNGVELVNYLSDSQLTYGAPVLEGTCLKNANIPTDEFVGAPDEVNNNNALVYITGGFSEGSKVIYYNEDKPSDAAVLHLPINKGGVVYFGWGWWNAYPIGSQDGGWMDLLEATINTLSCAAPRINLEEKYVFQLEEHGSFELEEEYFSSQVVACSNTSITFSKSLFNCDDLDTNQAIELTVTDEAGRSVVEVINIQIVDLNASCKGHNLEFQFSGVVTNPRGTVLPEVEVILESDNPHYLQSSEDGELIFPLNLSGKHYMHLEKENTRARGVSTFDLRQIQRHLLEVEFFKSPYQHIAADMNGDKKVDLTDLLIVKKLILHEEITEPMGENWYWISDDFIFRDELEPLDQEWNTLQGSTIDIKNHQVKILGIKSGDVDFSY